MKKITLLTALLATCVSLYGRVRVDVQCADGITLKNVKSASLPVSTTPVNAVENISRAVLISGNLDNQWKKFEFSFVPDKSGRIVLRFHTVGSRNISTIKPVWLDDVKVTGGTLLNGGFETMNNGKLASWGLGAKGKIITEKKAFEGSQCVQVFFSSGMATQNIIVSAGETVTVSFMSKLAE